MFSPSFGTDDMLQRLAKHLETHASLPPDIADMIKMLIKRNVIHDTRTVSDLRAMIDDKDNKDAPVLCSIVATALVHNKDLGHEPKRNMLHSDVQHLMKEIKAAATHLLNPREPSGIFKAPTRTKVADIDAVVGLRDLLHLVWTIRTPRQRVAPWNDRAGVKYILDAYENNVPIELHPLAAELVVNNKRSGERLMLLTRVVASTVTMRAKAHELFWHNVHEHERQAPRFDYDYDHAERLQEQERLQARQRQVQELTRARVAFVEEDEDEDDEDDYSVVSRPFTFMPEPPPKTPERPTKPVKPWAPPRKKITVDMNAGMTEDEALAAALEESRQIQSRQETLLAELHRIRVRRQAKMKQQEDEVIDLVDDDEDDAGAAEHDVIAEDDVIAAGAEDAAAEYEQIQPQPSKWYVAGGRRGDKTARRHKTPECRALAKQTYLDEIDACDLSKHKACKLCSKAA